MNRRVTGRVTNLKRMPSSPEGNPRWMVTLLRPTGDETKRKTVVNSQLAYDIEDERFRLVEHTFQVDRHGELVRVATDDSDSEQPG